MHDKDTKSPKVKVPEELLTYKDFLKGELPGFMRFIGKKELNRGDVDRLSAAWGEQFAAKIDCTQCGNCCRSLEPELLEDEIGKLAELAKMSLEEFSESEIVQIDGEAVFYMKAKPCRFLTGNCCSIYNDRPESCRSFPRFDAPGFRFRLSVRHYAAICPIVASVLIELADYYDYPGLSKGSVFPE